MKRPVLAFFVFPIKLYQVFLSAHFGGACRFHPSCSRYAEEILLSQPLPKAFGLIVKRLLKCHSFGPFGPDPGPCPGHVLSSEAQVAKQSNKGDSP